MVIKLYQELLFTERMYFNTYGEKIAIQRVGELLEFHRDTGWIGYALVPFVLLLKISFTAFCLNIGALVADWKVSFRQFFRIALTAEMIFVAANVIRAIWLNFSDGYDTLFQVSYFYPLSLINLFSPENLNTWFTYPLITANLFEILYVMALAVGIHWKSGRTYGKSLVLTVASYGTGLLIWVVFVVFLSVNLS